MNTIQMLIQNLNDHKIILEDMLKSCAVFDTKWKLNSEKWSAIEILCHLIDEEIEDFRSRLEFVILKKTGVMPSIDPTFWVNDRKYIEQNFKIKLDSFVSERKKSIYWLQNLKDVDWKHYYAHPKIGKMSAEFILTNWVAHDLLHIRQLIKWKYDYLKNSSSESIHYAGEW